MLSMMASAAVFLRWLPQHGWFAGCLTATATIATVAIGLGRKRRLQRAIEGIHEGIVQPHAATVTALAACVIILSLLGICAVLFSPFAP